MPPRKRKRVEIRKTVEEQVEQGEETIQNHQEEKNKEKNEDEIMKTETQTDTQLVPAAEEASTAQPVVVEEEEEEEKEEEEKKEETEEEDDSSTTTVPIKKISKFNKKKLASATAGPATLQLLDGVSFIITGNVNRSKVEGLITEHGGTVSKTVLKKHQYVIEGPGFKNEFGRYNGSGSILYREAKKKKKTFMNEKEFLEWIKKIEELKDKEEERQKEFENNINKVIKEESDIFEEGINLIIDYTHEEFPIVGYYRDWIELELSATNTAITLPPPATDEEIKNVEKLLRIRLPLWLKQLLRIHNGSMYHTKDNTNPSPVIVFPSTTQILAANNQVSQSLIDLTFDYNALRWIPIYHYVINKRFDDINFQSLYCLLILPEIMGNTVVKSHIVMKEGIKRNGDFVIAESLGHLLELYVKQWKENVANKGEDGYTVNYSSSKAKFYSSCRPCLQSVLMSESLKNYNPEVAKQKQLVNDRFAKEEYKKAME